MASANSAATAISRKTPLATGDPELQAMARKDKSLRLEWNGKGCDKQYWNFLSKARDCSARRISIAAGRRGRTDFGLIWARRNRTGIGVASLESKSA